jgi:hypothetical protein
MDRLDQATAALKAENKRLVQQLNQVGAAIAALKGITNNGRGMTSTRSGRTMSATGRKRIAAAQKARWAKWRAAQRKKAA